MFSPAPALPSPLSSVPHPHRKSFPISPSFHFSLSILILLPLRLPLSLLVSLPPVPSLSSGRSVGRSSSSRLLCSFNLSHYIKKGQHPSHHSAFPSFCSPDGEGGRRDGDSPLFGFLHVEVLAQILVLERSGAPLGKLFYRVPRG